MSDQFHVIPNRKSIIAERFDAIGMYQEIPRRKGRIDRFFASSWFMPEEQLCPSGEVKLMGRYQRLLSSESVFVPASERSYLWPCCMQLVFLDYSRGKVDTKLTWFFLL